MAPSAATTQHATGRSAKPPLLPIVDNPSTHGIVPPANIAAQHDFAMHSFMLALIRFFRTRPTPP